MTAGGETLLTFAAYDTLGGLDGAIDKGAERAIAPLGEAERAPAPPAPPARRAGAPGEADGAATLTISSVPLEEAAPDQASKRLVKALVDARVLLSSGSRKKVGECGLRMSAC